MREREREGKGEGGKEGGKEGGTIVMMSVYYAQVVYSVCTPGYTTPGGISTVTSPL